MDAAGNRVFLLFAIVADDVELAHALRDFAVFDDAVDLSNDRGFPRLARFEQFDHARKTARDVLGFSSGARNLRNHVAGMHVIAVRHH